MQSLCGFCFREGDVAAVRFALDERNIKFYQILLIFFLLCIPMNMVIPLRTHVD